jgi:hypothetical protein
MNQCFQQLFSLSALSMLTPMVLLANQAQCDDIVWASPVDGEWTEGTNWTNGVAPTFRDDVELGLFAPYIVELNVFRHARSVLISNPEAALEIRNGSFLNIITNISNDGLINIYPEGGDVLTRLRFDSDASLSGSGRVRLNSPMAQIRIDDGQLLTHASPHTIEGVGTINGAVLNQGVLDANGAGVLYANEITTNQGTLRASAGGELRIDQSQLNQTEDGLIIALGEGSRVLLDRSTVFGGRIQTEDGGRIVLPNQSGIRSAIVDAELHIETIGSTFISKTQFVNAKVLLSDTVGGRLSFQTSNELLGQGSFVLNDESGVIDFQTGFILPEAYTIEGRGGAYGSSMINRSTILANIPSGELRLSSLTNEGLIGAVNGGSFVLRGSIMNRDGEIFADGVDSRVSVGTLDAFIDFGIMSTTDGGLVENMGKLYLREMLLLCDIDNAPGSELHIYGLNYIEGEIFVDGSASLIPEDQSFIYGPGKVVLAGDGAELKGSVYSFTDYTVGEGFLVEGAGKIGSTQAMLFNGGVISANMPGESLVVDGRVRNQAVMQAVAGGRLEVTAYLEQGENGVILADGPDSRVQIGNELTHYTDRIIGGELRTVNDGIFEIGNGYTLDGVIINAQVEMASPFVIELVGGCELNGRIDLVPSAQAGGTIGVFEPNLLIGNGAIRLGASGNASRLVGGGRFDPLVLGPELRIEGLGTLSGFMRIEGTLAPGLGIGTLVANQHAELAETSTFIVEVGPIEQDRFECLSTLAMRGTVRVNFVDGFLPQGYWSREIATADEIETDRITLEMPEPLPGLVSRYFNTGTGLVIGQTCLADMNIDGSLSFFDVSLFLGYLQDQSQLADLNNDGRWNFFDVSIFLTSFRAGCP